MEEPVTLEYLSGQMDRLLAGLEAAHDSVREMTAAMLRCADTAQRVHRKLEEMSALMASYASH
jgi:hypothetical protein